MEGKDDFSLRNNEFKEPVKCMSSSSRRGFEDGRESRTALNLQEFGRRTSVRKGE